MDKELQYEHKIPFDLVVLLCGNDRSADAECGRSPAERHCAPDDNAGNDLASVDGSSVVEKRANPSPYRGRTAIHLSRNTQDR